MILPDGYSAYYSNKYSKHINSNQHCLRLKKSLYGLVQAARQWWKKFKHEMKKIGYYTSDIDLCLFIRNKEDNKKTFLILYIDDGGIFGTKEDIQETIDLLKKHSMLRI
jgi:Reverse transcriptase (RNA-dependent DNA polymerase)